MRARRHLRTGGRRALPAAILVLAATLAPAAGPAREDPYEGLHPFVGDIHVHTGLALYQAIQPEAPHSIGLPDQVLDAAASRGLDFVAITDHSNNLNAPRGRRWREQTGNTLTLPDGTETTDEWEYLKSAIRRHHRPGRFVVFLGIEYTRGTTETAQPGHQLGIFPTDGVDRFCSNFLHNVGDCPTARDFFDFVTEQQGVAVMAHPCAKVFWGPSDWSEVDPVLNAMELVSGSCENDRWGYNDALGRMGLRVGARGSSDSHLFEVGTNDKTVCFAGELTRPALLEAMKRNLCYYVDRHPVDLRFSINGVPMGGSLADGGEGLRLAAEAHTRWEADFAWLEIVHNGETLVKHECQDLEYDDCEMETYILSGDDGYYYAALSSYTGRRIAVSSPIWVRSEP